MDTKDNSQLTQHVAHLVADRAQAADVRRRADDTVKALDKQLYESLAAADTKRIQLTNGTVVQIIQPQDKQTLVREKLLAVGVSPEQIQAATETKPVSPYVKIDLPRAGADAQGNATPFGELPATPSPAPTTVQ